jgi:hypothetical protein
MDGVGRFDRDKIDHVGECRLSNNVHYTTTLAPASTWLVHDMRSKPHTTQSRNLIPCTTNVYIASSKRVHTHVPVLQKQPLDRQTTKQNLTICHQSPATQPSPAQLSPAHQNSATRHTHAVTTTSATADTKAPYLHPASRRLRCCAELRHITPHHATSCHSIYTQTDTAHHVVITPR